MGRPIDADRLILKFHDGPQDTQEERDANQVARYLIRHEPTLQVPIKIKEMPWADELAVEKERNRWWK